MKEFVKAKVVAELTTLTKELVASQASAEKLRSNYSNIDRMVERVMYLSIPEVLTMKDGIRKEVSFLNATKEVKDILLRGLSEDKDELQSFFDWASLTLPGKVQEIDERVKQHEMYPLLDTFGDLDQAAEFFSAYLILSELANKYSSLGDPVLYAGGGGVDIRTARSLAAELNMKLFRPSRSDYLAVAQVEETFMELGRTCRFVQVGDGYTADNLVISSTRRMLSKATYRHKNSSVTVIYDTWSNR